MKTKRFKTRTELINRENRNPNSDIWTVAIDAGYSSAKIFSPNKVACFPNFAVCEGRKADILWFTDYTILFRDIDANKEWVVGEVAQSSISSNDSTVSIDEICSKNRYNDPMFKVILLTGIGIGCMGNEFGSYEGKRIAIQSGLPEEYMSDKDILRDVIAGTHNFAIKLGKNDWVEFHITIDKEDVEIQSQPLGTLFSVCIARNGVMTKDVASIMTKNTVVFDAGFGTLDIYALRKGEPSFKRTYSNLGMKQVFKNVAKEIENNYNAKINVALMQEYLERGTFTARNVADNSPVEINIEPILKKCCYDLCVDALDKIFVTIDKDTTDYFIITGGTGDAWTSAISEYLKDNKNITVIYGNKNDDLPMIYSNVRGYYMNRVNQMSGG